MVIICLYYFINKFFRRKKYSDTEKVSLYQIFMRVEKRF